MKKVFFLSLMSLLLFSCEKQQDLSPMAVQDNEASANLAPATMPTPDHVVIVIMENHGRKQVIGNSDAPYINALAKDDFTANFVQSYAVTHPSQPNYIILYSGKSQGVTDDDVPYNYPFTTPNLGRQLLNNGKTFITYSEDLPYMGYDGEASDAYRRKHNPAANWIGTGKNQLPVTINQPFSAFPADYSQLPTVSYVIPNQDNDMHDGSISEGDNWLQVNMDDYIQWAKANNSLFILTFDEDDDDENNHIVTLFTGSMVARGKYTQRINHYKVLRTIEDMYRLPYIGNAKNVTTIDYCWK